MRRMSEEERVASCVPRGSRRPPPRCPWCGRPNDYEVALSASGPGEADQDPRAKLRMPVVSACCGEFSVAVGLDALGRVVHRRGTDEDLASLDPGTAGAVRRLLAHLKRSRRLENAWLN